MIPAIQHAIHIASHSFVDVFVSSGNDRFFWPYRLESVNDIKTRTRSQAIRYIVDSGVNTDEGTTDEEIIQAANDRQATFVIPNDVIHDSAATAERTAAFLETAAEQGLTATPLIPLQPPYKDHLELLEAEYPAQRTHPFFALGGIREEGPAEQLEHLREFREVVGWNAYAHALGMGGSLELIQGLRQSPGLVDSLDCSTPTKLVSLTGQIADQNWQPMPFQTPQGQDVSTLTSVYECGLTMQMAYMLSPLWDGAVNESQQRLEDFS